jgi:uncharacterized protein (DUF1919 family)
MKKFLKKIKKSIVDLKINKKRLDRVKKNVRKKYIDNNGLEDITILTPNCVAGEIYNLLGLKFNSPTINCSFEMQKYFIKFCCNLDEYLSIEPKIVDYIDGHPRMLLSSKNCGNIYINWPHDSDGKVVLENWNKRKKRVIKNRMFIITSNNYITDSDIDKLNLVDTLNTIIFTPKKIDKKNTFFVKKYQHHKKIGKYNVKKINGLYTFLDFFDFVSFLTNIKEDMK